jgi:hypothetical protein
MLAVGGEEVSLAGLLDIGCVRNREAYIAGWGGGKGFLPRKAAAAGSFDSIS